MDNSPAFFNDVREIARGYDFSQYALSLFLPAGQREAWWALLAFSAELQHIWQATTDERTALVRCAWWRDKVGELCAGGKAPAHPSLQAIRWFIGEEKTDPALWLGMIEAQSRWFTEEVPVDWPGFMGYCRAFHLPRYALFARKFAGEEGGRQEKLALMLACLQERERMAVQLRLPRPKGLPEHFLHALQDARSGGEVERLAEEEARFLLEEAERIGGELKASPPGKPLNGPLDRFYMLNEYMANKKLPFNKSNKFSELTYRASRKKPAIITGLMCKLALMKF